MTSKIEEHEQPGCSPAKENKLTKNNKADNSEKVNKKNFVKVCEQVSQNAFLNYMDRLQMLFLPKCSDDNNCKHMSKTKLKTINDKIQQVPPRALNSIHIEISGNMWHEALEISFLCITPKQYLTANVLRDIVEIMLNAHEDISSEYTVAHLISKCEQILALHFRMHPPCFIHENIINVYKTFLMGTTSEVKKKHSTRNEYDWDKGIIQYCFNRLEYELSPESKDGPLINRDEIIPEKLNKGTKRLHYQKEELEIFELLERSDRIDRLMAVLHSIIELLQFNLFIIKSRCSKTRHKPLIQELFWKEEINLSKNNFKIPEILKQIMKLFAHFVHLDYPEEYIKTINVWLNMAIEIVYYNDSYSNFDYPTIGSFGSDFVKEFYIIISDLPHKSIVKILERIQPNYMKFTIGLKYIKTVLKSNEDNIINVLIHFLRNSQWNDFPENVTEKFSLKKLDTAKVTPKNILDNLSKICRNVTYNKKNSKTYPKFYSHSDTKITLNIVISALYIVLNAYLDAYNIRKVLDVLEKINGSENDLNIYSEKTYTYIVTERFINIYKNIHKFLKELILVLKDLKKDNRLPEDLKLFENIFVTITI